MPDLVTIEQCANNIDADLLKMRLERAGIPVVLANQHIRNARGGLGGFAFYIWVQVPEEDAERARKIAAERPADLDEAEERELTARAEAADDCPACGSNDTRFEEATAAPPGAFTSASVIGVCGACGHRWHLG